MNTSSTSSTAPTTARRPQDRPATPERWHAALDRAHAQGVTVRQVDPCLWMAETAADPARRRLILVVNGVAIRCDCVASDYDDPVCLHRAAVHDAINRPAA